MGGDAMFSGTFLQRISTWKGEFLIGKSWDSQEGFGRRDFHRSRTEAQWFLQDLLSDSFAVMTLRDVLGGTETTLDLSRLSDHDVVDRLASKIASGRLAVFERSRLSVQHESTAVERASSEIVPPPAPAEVFRSVLAVQVVDEAGIPIEKADVALDMKNVGATPKDGVHLEGKVDPGTYDVNVVKEGYSSGTATVNVGVDSSVSVKVQMKRLRAKLVWPAHQADHKQYVNLDSAAALPNQGNRIKVKLKLLDGKAGDKAYVKLDYDDAKVSKRNNPAREVVGGLKAAWCPKGGKELTLKAANAQLEVEVELGLAGGDVVTISVGGTRECKDEQCKITTWRKLWYEIMAPDFMRLGADLGAGHRARVSALLGPCFVEYTVWKSHTFPEASAPAGTVFKAAYFNEAGRKRFVLTDHTFTLYPVTHGAWDNGKRPRSVGLRLCDRDYFNDRGTERVQDVFTAKKCNFSLLALRQRHVLPWSAHDGTDAIKSIDWVAKIDPATHSTHPAVSGGTPCSGHLSKTSVTFKNINEFQIDLPDGTVAAPGPGRIVGSLSATTCPIEVYVELEGADEGLGLSGQGAQSGENLVCYKENAPQSTVDVVVHELCHSAGMAAIGGNAPPPGIPQPKTTADVDPQNECTVSTLGHLYSGHGHSGGHCARGLNDAQKGAVNYEGMPGTCINFGETEPKDPSKHTAKVCKTCAIILKGRELQSI